MSQFSVIMPIYENDNLDFFKDAYESILNQSVIPNEIIIIVDGPIGSQHKFFLDEISKYSYVRVLYLEKNHGPGFSRAFGIKNSSHDIIALMDADDISVNDRFEKQLNYMRDEKLDIVGGWIEEFSKIPGDLNIIRKVPSLHNDIFKHGKWRMPVNNVTLMFRKQSYYDVGGYTHQRRNEDWSLIVRLLANKKIFYNIPDILVHARAGTDMVTRRRKFDHFFNGLKIFFLMHKTGYVNSFVMLANLFVRILLRILPQFVTTLIYNNIL